MPTPSRPTNAEEKPLIVDTVQVATLFAHPGRRRILFAFVGGDRSVGEVAASLDMPMNLLHYHVQRMVRVGLIRFRGKRMGPRRPVRLYRAVASAFIVPAALMPSGPDEELRRELRQRLDRQMADGYLFSCDANGRVRMRKQEGADARELWRVVRLDETDAHDVAARIGELLDAHERRAGRRAKSYLVHVALARRD